MIRYLTVEELAERYRTSTDAIYARRHRGDLPPALRSGKRLLWAESDLDAFDRQQKELGVLEPAPVRRCTTGRRSAKGTYDDWFKVAGPGP